MKKVRDRGEGEGVDYFIVEKDKYQRISQQRDKLADFIRWYVVQGGRGQLETANTECSIELAEKQEKYSGIYTLRRLQDAMTVAQAEGLLADVALAGQAAVTQALLESEAVGSKALNHHNKLAKGDNT